MSELGLTSQQQQGHSRTGPRFKVSFERLEKQEINLAIPGLVVCMEEVLSFYGRQKFVSLHKNCRKIAEKHRGVPVHLNHIALRMAKTLWSLDRSECNRAKNALQLKHGVEVHTKQYQRKDCVDISSFQ